MVEISDLNKDVAKYKHRIEALEESRADTNVGNTKRDADCRDAKLKLKSRRSVQDRENGAGNLDSK